MKPSRSRFLVLVAALSLGSTGAFAQTSPQATLTVLHHFEPSDVNSPVGRLVQGPDKSLYGVLIAGGTYGRGSVYKLDASFQFSELFSFGPTDDFDAVTGAYPRAGLIFGADGNLYGSTSQGGPGTGGTVFRLTPSGELTTLVAFSGGAPPGPSRPDAPLFLAPDGNFYGTTDAGGANGAGTIFKMTPTGTVIILHSFAADASEGSGLSGTLALGSDGALYGTTSVGGLNAGIAGDGTVYRITTDGSFSVLHYFPYTASNAIEGLAVGSDGAFFGLTQAGGADGNAFRITPGGDYSILHAFGCTDCGPDEGAQPVGTLTLASSGDLFGVTSYGGATNAGTIFSIKSDGTLTPLHSLLNSEGGAPTGGVMQGGDGSLYGVTSGLFSGDPTVYQLTLQNQGTTTGGTTSTSGGGGAIDPVDLCALFAILFLLRRVRAIPQATR
jgi:uncharacterized repeat protein (TIGR03803 family)